MDTKPFSPACERNRDPILAVLRRHFVHCGSVLEVGSGTGQHAVHFARALPWLSWQCADLAPQLPGIRQWLDEAGLPNTPPPLALDVCEPWPEGPYDAVFSANILHIVGWTEVEAFFAGVGRVLGAAGMLAVYGPFNANGIYTSTSNRDFDARLKARDPRSGIRDAEAVQGLAAQAGLHVSMMSRCRRTTGVLSGGGVDAIGVRPAIRWCSCRTGRRRKRTLTDRSVQISRWSLVFCTWRIPMTGPSCLRPPALPREYAHGAFPGGQKACDTIQTTPRC